MLLLRTAFVPFVCTAFCLSTSVAGDHFLQFRVEKTRCCITDHGYQTQGKPESASVISASGIDLPLSRRRFVIGDVTAGKVVLSGLTALAVNDRELTVSGELKHSGNVNEFNGGQVDVRIEALTVTTDGATQAVVIGDDKKSLWLPAGKPKSITLKTTCGAGPGNSLEKIERVRVYLTYRPGR